MVSLPMPILGLHLNDCSAFDHSNHWIFDANIDLAKTSWTPTTPPPDKSSPDRRLFNVVDKVSEMRYVLSQYLEPALNQL